MYARSKKTLERGHLKCSGQGSKVAVLESKLDMYEELSKEMLTKLESAVEKISEGNNRIAQILTKHDERIEQSMKTDDLIIKMIDELKETENKNNQIIHERIDRLQVDIKKGFSKFRWQVGGVLLVGAMMITAGSHLIPTFLTATTTGYTRKHSKKKSLTMDLVDSKYIGLVSSRLQKFKKVKTNLYNFRCPICGDSQRNKNKDTGISLPGQK